MASNEPREEKTTHLLLVLWAELVLQEAKPVPELSKESGGGSCGQGMVLVRVLPLCSCSFIQLMHWLGCFTHPCPGVSNGRGHRHPQRAFQTTCVPFFECPFCPLMLGQTKSPPLPALALQWEEKLAEFRPQPVHSKSALLQYHFNWYRARFSNLKLNHFSHTKRFAVQVGTNKPSEADVGSSVQLPSYTLLIQLPFVHIKDVYIEVLKLEKVAATPQFHVLNWYIACVPGQDWKISHDLRPNWERECAPCRFFFGTMTCQMWQLNHSA